jgi:Gpi18-like mannosyltransferase
MKNHRVYVLIVFLIALIWRLVISPLGFHDDLMVNTAWGEWIYKNGPLGFYQVQGWIYSSPTQPPLISLLYGFNLYLYERLQWLFTNIGVIIATYRLIPTKMMWFFDFTKWFGMVLYSESALRMGALVSMKLIAILADMLIATVIYFLIRNKDQQKALIWSAIYLFSPFSWYLSALWGQYDQLSFLFLVLAFIAILYKRHLLAPILLVFSFEFKPTSLIFVPFFAWLYLKQKPGWKNILMTAVICLLLTILSIKFFTNDNILVFIQNELIPKIFFKSEFRVSTNSFNFWRILTGDQALNQNTLFFWIPAKIWGWGVFILLNFCVLKSSKKNNLETIFQGLSIIGIGSWLFLTNMLDRYVFAGITALLIWSALEYKLFKYWLILSLIFWLNLFNHWWFPTNLAWLRQILSWQDDLITRLLSLIFVLIYIKIFFDRRKIY